MSNARDLAAVRPGKGAGSVATNTAVGASAIAATATATRSTAVGYQALTALTSGDPNTAVGAYALKTNTTGAANVGVGAYALQSNTNGASNSAFGNEAMSSNTTGSSNTAIGANALISNTTASRNTAVGYQAGYTNSTGQYNSFFGYTAGRVETSSGNTYIGDSSGYSTAATSGFNTFIGQSAGYFVTTGSKNTILGGYSGNAGGLDIRTSSNYIVLSDGDGNVPYYYNGTNGVLLGTSNNFVASIFSKGTGSQTYVDFRVGWSSNSSVGTQTGTITTNGTSTTYGTTSDYRLKDNPQPMVGALEKIAALKPVTYTWKANGSSGEGFIAHELAEVCPDAVVGEKDAVNEDGTPKYQNIDTSFLVATLVAAIKELKAEIDILKGQA